MQSIYKQRLRLRVSKLGPARFIGHLDLARTLERTFNRARLPVARTQGFNRRPKMELAAALPLGFTSEGELVDVWMRETVSTTDALERLKVVSAPGVEVIALVEVPLSEASLGSRTQSAEYYCELGASASRDDLDARIAKFMDLETVELVRKGKSTNIRPLLHEMSLEAEGVQPMAIWMRVVLMPSRTGRPDRILESMGLDPADCKIHRIRIELAGD